MDDNCPDKVLTSHEQMKTQTSTEAPLSTRTQRKKPAAHGGFHLKKLQRLFRYWWFWLLLVLLVAILIVHTFLAIWVRDYVNRKLSEIPGYRAHVAAVTLHLWRGAYQIHGLDIKKTNGKVPVPFFAAPLIDLSAQWRALIFERAFVGNIEIHRPEMNLVNSSSEETRQAPVDEPWAQKVKQLFPLKINRFAVHNGEIRYRDYSHDPKVNLWVDRVQMVATNLTNSKKLSKNLIADIRIEGRPLGVGDARSQISLDPYAAKPTFAFNLELRQMPLVKLNDFSKAYGHFTFDAGTLKVAMEATAKNGAYRGYIEPVFDHMSIFNPAKEDNALTAVWEAILEGITRIVRNHPRDRFGTKVPFSGTFEKPNPEILTTIFNAFRNAFIKAFEGELPSGNKVPKVEPEKKQ
jgi:Domain of Unknown Function (DUF748)